YPEFVDDIFNDTFIAELDRSNWRSSRNDPSINAPRNFAIDREGNPIRVNRVGDTTMSAFQARGTTYDGATRLLRASTPVTPGRHNLYLSIFDQGDRIFDSAVFLDNMGTTNAKECRTGVALQK
ncbi:MAG: choice-of-anchor L domain-containing protein, partial [Candidatus Limnocylindrales bacterium]